MNHVAALELSNLAVGIDAPVFASVDLTVHPGQFVTIMGENGVGKTVLIDALRGYWKPTQGGIKFWGQTLSPAQQVAINRRTGWVLSHEEDYPWGLTVGGLLSLVSRHYPQWRTPLVEDLCSRFGLALQKRCASLSTGERSKVKLVKALGMAPELLVLDELTSNLASGSRKVIIDALIEDFSSRSMAILYVSHDADQALRLSDTVYRMTESGLSVISSQDSQEAAQ